jgi:L-lactate dehydrogenase
MAHSSGYPRAKVAIVGTGFVGSTIAYALMMGGSASEIALIDAKKDKADGEALDLMHCMQFTSSVHITSGDDFALVKDAAVVIITAGIAQKAGQARTELLRTNIEVFKNIIPKIVTQNKDCILLVVSNPLDVLTYATWKLSNFPSCKVFGTGTVLDSARLRYLMGEHFKVSPKDITAHVLGEHGDSEFVCWSNANIAGVPVNVLPGYDIKAMDTIFQKAKNAAYEIISKKGATYYAIGLVTAKIVRAILLDQSRVFSVSTFIDEAFGVKDICLSLPTVVRKSGTCERLPIQLSNQEIELFIKSAQKVKNDIDLVLI